MTDVAHRYRRLADRFAGILAAVPTDRWGDQSPCEEWTALDVARHMVEVHGMFEKLAGRPIEVPDVSDDPLGAFDEVRAIVQADLDDPERAAVSWDGFFGPTTFAEGVDRFVCFDLVVHGWDLARAAGIDDPIPADELDHLEADLAYFGDALTASGAVGTPIEAGPDADRATRLLAALGRQA